MSSKPATKEQIDEAVEEITKQFSQMEIDHLIGFLLGAKDDEMFQPKNDDWLKWTHEKLVDEAVTAYLNMAIAMKQGKVFKSELRGSTPFGVA
ncbi:hypothetical protein [Immundisolibacter sp.]